MYMYVCNYLQYIYIYIHIHIYIYTYTYIDIHTYTHMVYAKGFVAASNVRSAQQPRSRALGRAALAVPSEQGAQYILYEHYTTLYHTILYEYYTHYTIL